MLKTTESFRRLIEEHHVFYEVVPHYTMPREPKDRTGSTRRIPAGFDVDIYGSKDTHSPGADDTYLPGINPDYLEFCTHVRQLIAGLATAHSCSIEVIPFGSTVCLDTGRQFTPQAMLRIRIAHTGTLDEPAGKAEELVLKQVQELFAGFGLRCGKR